ncbi:Asp-tRNA(Asn)/Glu-tRNA(Gln) amidotransferase subunit GatC [Candidatus Microgenomates bacterium]|nr:Asp-tRNA(Asn)/Glu-tRNA(Gln) amidotransferase subunit GatC [Candidatus Microgenomates bacterium]
MISSSKIAKLANLPIKSTEEGTFTKQLESILDIVSKLQKVATANIVPTAQVTGQVNVFRDDEIDVARMFSQEQALSNAKQQKNGFFVVPAIFE